MVISCPCGAKLRIGDEKLTAAGVKVKCPKCSTVHLVKRPADAPPAAVQRPAPPASGDAAPAPEPAMPWFAPSSPVSRPAGPLVLIAHDSTVVANMMEGVLNEEGISTEYAPNGLEALKKATELKPQAMIVDVGLTGIYGFELCERLKSDPETREIRIVLLSSVYGLTAYKRSPVSLYGADDYIEKHHIPDQLVPKVRRLLSGAPAEAPPPPEQEQTQAPEAEAADTRPLVPLISRKGVLQPTPAASEATATAPREAERQAPSPAVPQAASAARGAEPTAPVTPSAEPRSPKIEIPEIPSVLPRTPVTLDESRKRPAAHPVAAPPAPAAPAPAAQAPAAARFPQERTPAPGTAPQDGSIDLEAAFFEHEEYVRPSVPQAAVDPEEVEKARRFARIIVSDIALYNQEAVLEGVMQGTFYELLKDDIAEGRALYESRVPDPIRTTGDYLQEAFDNFIAAKKKPR